MFKYIDLRDFVAQLEQQKELKTIATPISPILEMTEISDRVLRNRGPALYFSHPVHNDKHWNMPVLTNLFGTPRRVAMGMGAETTDALREIGHLLAYLKEPDPPKGLKDAWEKWPLLKQILSMSPKITDRALCQQTILEGDEVDLLQLPIQHCWPGDYWISGYSSPQYPRSDCP